MEARDKKVVDFINRNKPVVIGVNSLLEGYNYDYIFFS